MAIDKDYFMSLSHAERQKCIKDYVLPRDRKKGKQIQMKFGKQDQFSESKDVTKEKK